MGLKIAIVNLLTHDELIAMVITDKKYFQSTMHFNFGFRDTWTGEYRAS
jgi:hypothetical protein